MDLPIDWPLTPMLAKAVSSVPAADAVAGGYCYEPKWDGFRGIIARDGDQVQIGSRGSKPLTRYFPELVQAALRYLPAQCVVDGEIVVRSGPAGAERLDWEALSQRIHPADSRIELLSTRTPAEFICFDLLALGGQSLIDADFAERRRLLEQQVGVLGDGSPMHLTRISDDAAQAQEWFEQFEGAGLDGVIVKPWRGPYQSGKRVMLKIKHARTAEAVLLGYRVHKSGSGVGSLLLGLYTDGGELVHVGGISAFTRARRLELIEELEPWVVRDDDGEVVRSERERTRFSSGKDVSFVQLRPQRVVEVAFDQLEGDRFRHAVRFLRWRPDRDPAGCTLDQVDRAVAYDLAAVLQT